MADLYLWMKTLHIVSVIAWMAGLFYLPRLFVYHTGAEVGSEMSETFKVMERRLLKAIMGPAMHASWVFGSITVYLLHAYLDLWFLLKLSLVLLMTVFHVRLSWHVRRFAEDNNKHSERYFRIINEVPTVLMIGIVILVIFKP
ncbi:protoporphyrinogen oxidase HemJ [Pseudovibrio exalbescens]|uniref:protoporphyrinogen oxidase HemJ n=1 Tax=Pseudovibrio exalbescens TaxID=197461 RepID=UPI0023661793|nr:protoporphyrinogen oxidase HemJ [Pseudovibrio exalbescens]MDD7909526.1 protoporphyrinogen oxidase HemJ [Pseudovibrio exalbescens]